MALIPLLAYRRSHPNQISNFLAARGGWALHGMDSFIYAHGRFAHAKAMSYSCTTEKLELPRSFSQSRMSQAGAWENCVGRYVRLPTLGKDSYFWGGVVGVLEPVLLALVFLALCFEVFLTFAGAVLFWPDAGWLCVAGVVACAKIMGKLAAAKTIAIKLFFMLISPCGTFYLSRPFHLAATAVLIR
jgi:hypothetical protein